MVALLWFTLIDMFSFPLATSSSCEDKLCGFSVQYVLVRLLAFLLTGQFRIRLELPIGGGSRFESKSVVGEVRKGQEE